MYSTQIRENDAGQRFDKYLKKLLPAAPDSFLYKMLRKKNITLNGKKATGDVKVCLGDEVKLFFSPETLLTFSGGRIRMEEEGEKQGVEKRKEEKKEKQGVGRKEKQGLDKGREEKREKQGVEKKEKKGVGIHAEHVPSRVGLKGRRAKLSLADYVLYEDEDVLFLNKPAGILSQPDKSGIPSLGEYLEEYLLSTGALSAEDLLTFHPGVCNRLDRNTSGICLAGKSLRGLQALSELIRERNVKKEYLLLAEGEIREEREITAYLHKEEKCNKVWLQNGPEKGGVKIVTRITPVGWGPTATLVLAELVTGKSHQIRAQLSSLGHPLLGDVKYGGRKRPGISRQMLHAYRMCFPGEISRLPSLEGRVILAPLPKDFRDAVGEMIGEPSFVLDSLGIGSS